MSVNPELETIDGITRAEIVELKANGVRDAAALGTSPTTASEYINLRKPRLDQLRESAKDVCHDEFGFETGIEQEADYTALRVPKIVCGWLLESHTESTIVWRSPGGHSVEISSPNHHVWVTLTEDDTVDKIGNETQLVGDAESVAEALKAAKEWMRNHELPTSPGHLCSVYGITGETEEYLHTVHDVTSLEELAKFTMKNSEQIENLLDVRYHLFTDDLNDRLS